MFDEIPAAEKQPTTRVAVCWECGQKIECSEYIVCCTGAIFHICPACEAKIEGGDAEPEESTEQSVEAPARDAT